MTDDAVGRRLSFPAWIGVVIAYLVVLKVSGALIGPDDGTFDALRSNSDVLRALVVPIGISFLFAVAVVTWLGWWGPVLVDHRPVQRWVLVVPAIFLVAIVIAIDYGELADRRVSFVLLLLLGLLLVGATEELMFRGTGVHVLRANGMTEAKVALWSSVIFGAVHLSNAIGAGGGAVFQAVAVSFAGYFFYLTRRATGGLLVGAIIHGLFDFSLISGEVSGTAYAPSAAAILAYVVAGAVVLRRRHRIEPRA